MHEYEAPRHDIPFGELGARVDKARLLLFLLITRILPSPCFLHFPSTNLLNDHYRSQCRASNKANIEHHR
jgi:hypothetical protein